jgi:hypothetical protein
MIPLMNELERVITGITTQDIKIHKVKGFADDLKIFLSNLGEIETCYNIIEKFEKI